MANFRQFTPTTAAVTTNLFYTDQYDSITVSADHLAGAETVTIQVMVGTMKDGYTPVQATDIYGTPVNLTAMNPRAVGLEGGAPYRFVKSVTADPCSVYVDVKECP